MEETKTQTKENVEDSAILPYDLLTEVTAHNTRLKGGWRVLETRLDTPKFPSHTRKWVHNIPKDVVQKLIQGDGNSSQEIFKCFVPELDGCEQVRGYLAQGKPLQDVILREGRREQFTVKITGVVKAGFTGDASAERLLEMLFICKGLQDTLSAKLTPEKLRFVQYHITAESTVLAKHTEKLLYLCQSAVTIEISCRDGGDDALTRHRKTLLKSIRKFVSALQPGKFKIDTANIPKDALLEIPVDATLVKRYVTDRGTWQMEALFPNVGSDHSTVKHLVSGDQRIASLWYDTSAAKQFAADKGIM